MILILTLALAALQDPQPRKQDDVTVQERKDPSLTTPSLDEAKRRLDLVPGGSNLLDSADFREARVAHLEDLFRLTPGVFAVSRFGYEEARISIRGSGIQRTFHGRGLRVLQDGIPINLADGSFDMQQIEPYAARYVEVHRGANALRYGGVTLGGAVNFVSVTGHEASPLIARLEMGSFGYVRTQLASGGASGDLDGYVSVTTLEADGFRQHADQENVRIFANGGYRISDALENRLYLTYVQTDSELPGSLTMAQMRDDPRQANPVNRVQDQKRDFDFFRVVDRLGWRSGDARADVALAWTHKHLDHPIFQVIDQVNDDLVLNAAYTSEAQAFGRRNLFTIGGLLARGQTEEDRYVNLGGNPGAKTADQDLTAVSFEVFAENQHYLTPQLAMVLGVQAVVVAMELDDEFLSNGDNSDSENFSALNPKIGFRYEVDKNIQVFVNGSRAFENPSFAEITNNAAGGLNFPDAQSAWTLEIGTRGRAGAVGWDLALYHAWIRDELLSLIDPVTSAPLGTVNADKTVHRGVEAGLDLDVLDLGQDGKLVARASYLFSDFRFQDDAAFGNNELAGIPRHVLNAELAFESGFGLVIAPTLHYVPVKTYVDHANTIVNPKHAAWGLRAAYAVGKISFFVDARNLTNRVYAGTTGVIANAGGADQAQYLPADGRSVYGGVEFKW